MGPIDFIGDKLKQFGSDIASGTTDAFDAATHALGDVFGSNTPSSTATAPKAPAVQTPSQPSSIGSLPINNPLSTQNQQGQQPAPLKLNFGQNQTQQSQTPQNTPTQLNTNLVNFNNIKTKPLAGSFGQTPQTQPTPNNGGGAAGDFIGNQVKQVTNIAAAPVNLGKSLVGMATGNPTAELNAANQAKQDVGNNLLTGIGKGVINLGKAAYYAPPTIAAELQNKPIPNNDATKGLTALNQSFEGPLLTGPESIITHNIQGAAPAAQQAGFNPNASIASVVAKTAAGAVGAASPLYGASKLLQGFGGAEAGAAGDADIAAATDNITKIAKTNLPKSDEESLNATAPAPAKITQRDPDAERAALDTLQKGGTKNDAVRAYQSVHPGTTKDVSFQVSRAAREANTALRPNERSVNPELDQHSLPKAEPGDYERAEVNKSIVDNSTDSLLKKANQSLTNLSQADRDNFEDYLEKTKPIEQADDAGKVQQAIQDSLKLTDTGNALDHQVGGTTPHIDNYFPGYTMRDDPETIARDNAQAEQDVEERAGPKAWNNMSLDDRRQAIAEELADKNTTFPDDENFGGFKNQKRQFANRAERKAAGINDEYDDPRDALTRYAQGLKFKIGNDAFSKAAQEADRDNQIGKSPSNTVDLGGGKRTQLSDQGYKALKNNDIKSGRGNVLVKVNRLTKQANIALGVPHAVIIPPRFAGALSEIKASTAMHSGLQNLSEDAADLSKVDVDKAPDPDFNEKMARVGSPIHSERINAGVSDTKTGAKFNPLTAPKRLVYNWLLPQMHTILGKALLENLEARDIDLDSDLAHSYGKQLNDVMGYSKNGSGLFDQSTFAPSLIKSTANLYGKSLTADGDIARGGVAGQQLVNQALGFISKAVSNQISQNEGKPQNKSKDSFWSTVLKETVSPSIYTPFRKGASKGNPGEQIDLGIPGQYQSDALKVALNLKRDKGGQLGVGLNSPAQALTNLAQTGKNIASPVLSAALSGVTNQTYSGQQVRNPYASPLTQLEQTAVNSGASALPINLQTPADQALSKVLPPKFNQDIPQNQTGSTALRVAAQTFGLNPKADTTTGQGPATAQYYNGITKGQDYIAANSNNPTTQTVNETAFQQYYSRAKNNAGQTILLGPQASKANAAMLASNPTALAGVQVAEKANGKGNYNPIWDLPANKLQTYMTYESLADGDPNRTVLEQKNPWLVTEFGQEQTYFNSISNTSKAVPGQGYVAYPNISPSQSNMMSQVTTLASNQNRSPAQETQLENLENNPDLQAGYTLLDQYTNSRRQSEGLQPIPYPSQNLTPQQSALLAQESALPSNTGAKSSLIKANQGEWNNIEQILGQDTIYNVEKYGGVIQQGGAEPDFLKDTYEAGTEDIAKTTTAGGGTQYSLNPVLAYAQGSGSGSGSSSSSNPLVPMPKIKRQKQPKMKKPPHLKGFRAPHIKKQGRVKIQAPGIQHTQVLKPTAVVKLAH